MNDIGTIDISPRLSFNRCFSINRFRSFLFRSTTALKNTISTYTAIIPPLYAHIKASIISWGRGGRLCGTNPTRRGKNSANWQRKQTVCIVQYPAARRQEHPSAVQNTVHASLNIDTSILCSRAYRVREPTVLVFFFLLSLRAKRYAKNKYIRKNRREEEPSPSPSYPSLIIALQLHSRFAYPIRFNCFFHPHSWKLR